MARSWEETCSHLAESMWYPGRAGTWDQPHTRLAALLALGVTGSKSLNFPASVLADKTVVTVSSL